LVWGALLVLDVSQVRLVHNKPMNHSKIETQMIEQNWIIVIC